MCVLGGIVLVFFPSSSVAAVLTGFRKGNLKKMAQEKSPQASAAEELSQQSSRCFDAVGGQNQIKQHVERTKHRLNHVHFRSPIIPRLLTAGCVDPF